MVSILLGVTFGVAPFYNNVCNISNNSFTWLFCTKIKDDLYDIITKIENKLDLNLNINVTLTTAEKHTSARNDVYFL